MNTLDSQLIFHADSLTITYNNEVIVDLSNVPNSPEARVYSGYTSDFTGVNTTFNISNTKQPFDLGATFLSLEAFLCILVENRLELEGMIVEDTIIDAYNDIINSNWLTKMLYDDNRGATT